MNQGVRRYEAAQEWVADGAVRTWSFSRIGNEESVKSHNISCIITNRTSQPSLNAKGICWLNFPPEHWVYNSSHVQKGADNLTLSTLAVCFLKPWLTSAVQVSGKYLTFLAKSFLVKGDKKKGKSEVRLWLSAGLHWRGCRFSRQTWAGVGATQSIWAVGTAHQTDWLLGIPLRFRSESETGELGRRGSRRRRYVCCAFCVVLQVKAVR